MDSNQILIIIGIIIIGLLLFKQQPTPTQRQPIQRQPIQRQPLIPSLRVQQDRIRLLEENSRSVLDVVGVVHSQSTTNDLIFQLLGKPSLVQKHRFIYAVRDLDTGLLIHLNKAEPMNELYSGDLVNILGKESAGPFIVYINPKPPLIRT